MIKPDNKNNASRLKLPDTTHSEAMLLIDKELNISILGALLVAFFYSNVIHEKVADIILIGWLCIMVAVYSFRFILIRYISPLTTRERSNSYHWEKRVIISTFFSGLLWGGGSYLMLPENNPLVQAVVTLTLGGLVAASSVTYSPSKYLGASFGIPSLLPLVVFYFQKAGNEYFYMGILVLIYLVVMLFSNRLMHDVTIKSIMLGRKNETLIDDLRNKIVKIEDMTSEMSYQATHDVLTGLLNRREFEIRLEQSISDVKKNKRNHALCYMDLDEFKVVNDTCGHVAGDTLLKDLSNHLAEKIRGTDTIARLGGDEFGLLLPLCKIEKAREIAENLREIIKQFQFCWDNKIFDVGVSIGLVEINENTGTLTDALKAADSACYIAKDLGKNRIHVYEEDDQKLTQRLGYMHCVQAIQKSLIDDNFVLYVQEIHSANNGDIRWHGEILVRMLGDNNEIISPDNFIPAAERYHLMVDIDKWVVDKAFRFIYELEKKFDSSILCAINLSGQSICDKNFLDYVVNKLDEINIRPESVCFEITETAAVSNFFHAQRLLEVLKGMGCSFSLDDFGSGLSSFGYLKKLDVDYLKIDGNFVKTMLDDKKDFAMVKSINQIGKEMGIKTIAEFVENNELRKELTDMDVDYVQGYGVAKPVPVSTIINQDS